MMSRALVACGQRGIASALQRMLEEDGWDVTLAADEVAFRRLSQTAWDIIFLGPALAPQSTPETVCESLRDTKRHRETAIIVIAEHDDEDAEVRAFEAGADEYRVWPIRPRVFRARLRSMVRRMGGPSEGVVRVGEGTSGIEIDARRHSVRVDGREMDLTLTQYRILQFLALRPGFVRTREQIVTAVRGGNAVLSSRAVDVHVAALRQKLGSKGSIIETVRGVGYRLSESVGQAAETEELEEIGERV